MSVLFCDVATIYNYYESEDGTEDIQSWSKDRAYRRGKTKK